MEKYKKVLVAIAVFPAFVLIGIAWVQVSVEIKHKEEKCPWHRMGQKKIGSKTVLEEAHRCMAGFEERRWVMAHGDEKMELGVRRLPRTAFGKGYRWTLTEDASDGAVVLTLANPGHGTRTFRDKMKPKTKHE